MNKYGSIIFLNRTIQNLSISALSEISNVDIGLISRIERGQLENSIKINALLEALGIDINNVDKAIYETEMALSIVLDRKINVLDTKEYVDSINQKYLNNCPTIELLLINLMHMTVELDDVNKDEFDRLVYLFEKLKPIMGKRQLKIYYVFLGLHYSNEDHVDEAIKCFELARDITEGEVKLHAICLYYLGREYMSSRRNQFSAILVTKEAIDLFEKEAIYVRIGDATLNIANMAFNQKEYNKAEELYRKAIKIFEQFERRKNLIIKCISNIENIYVEQEQYEKFLEEHEKLDEETKILMENGQVFITNLIFSLYKVNHYEECTALLSTNRDKVKSVVLQKVLMYVEEKIANKKNAYLHLKRAMSYMKREGYYGNAPFVLKLLINEFEEKGDYKNALLYSKMYIEII